MSGRAPRGPAAVPLPRRPRQPLGVTMLEVVDAVDAGLRRQGRGRVVMPPKLSLHGEGDAYSQVMAATLPGNGGLGAKWVTIFPQNADSGLPVTNGLVVLSDPQTGLPSAVMDAGDGHRLAHRRQCGGRRRATSRARTRAVLGVLGCGVQARASVRALAAVLPGLDARALPRRGAAAAAGGFVAALGRGAARPRALRGGRRRRTSSPAPTSWSPPSP